VDLILDIGLSERDRRIGFSTEAGAPAPPTRAIGESRARQGDALAVCKEKIVRLTITLMSQSQRQVAYQGSADDLRCAAPDDDNLKALANVALANLRVTHSRVSD
jgi:hypothetical protein